MGELTVRPSLTDRMVRAARLETSLYNEVEADLSATQQALTVVVIVAIAGGIGSALGAAIAGRPAAVAGGLIGGIIAELLGWLVWSYVMYLVGTRVFHVLRRLSAVRPEVARLDPDRQINHPLKN